jgi:predicted nucleotidyltransferase
MASGARAVTLHGSHARGDAHAHSDIDIVAIGGGPEYELSHRRGRLVSVSWYTRAKMTRIFGDPALVGSAIPGWREAVILADPDGIAASLKRRAERWSWDRIGATCDRWVADEFTGWAEEVHKLAAMLDRNERLGASVQRAVLAIRLAPILAVHRRIFYGSENRLWDLVSEAMGEPWASTQRAALSLDGESHEDSARAALRLYARAAEEIRPLLSPQQREVVDHALKLADRPVRPPTSDV